MGSTIYGVAFGERCGKRPLRIWLRENIESNEIIVSVACLYVDDIY